MRKVEIKIKRPRANTDYFLTVMSTSVNHWLNESKRKEKVDGESKASYLDDWENGKGLQNKQET